MKTIATALGTIALLFGAFAIHLALEGEWQRSNLKAWVKALAWFESDIVIRPGGGSCSRIGRWDPGSSTCLLEGDLTNSEAILLTGHGVSFDGQGHRMKGDRSTTALTVVRASEFAIRNVRIENYLDGIFVDYSTRGTIEDVEIEGNERYAIRIENDSHWNTIRNNRASHCGFHGISLLNSSGNIVTNNVIFDTRDAIRLQTSYNNFLVGNTVSGNRIEGFDLHDSWRNVIAFNQIMEEEAVPIISHPFELEDNFFNLEFGGNHYAVFGSDKEGCSDENGDRLCDAPFRFDGGQDSMPLRAEFFRDFDAKRLPSSAEE